MLSQSKNTLLEAVYQFGGFVTVPAVMSWKHISAAAARKSLGKLRNLCYIEPVDFTGAKNYPAIYRITGAGVFYLRHKMVQKTDEMYSYSILYKVITSHTLFALAGNGITGILTQNAQKISYLKALGYNDEQFDRKMNRDTPFLYFGDIIIKGKGGFTSLYPDRPWNDAGNLLETRLKHLQKFLKAGKSKINLMISTDRADRKEAFEWAYEGFGELEKPEKFVCKQLDYCYTRL